MGKYSFALGCINELKAESKATKKCLQGMKWELDEYKPHHRSMTMESLAF